jgi:hypothetical protein
LVGLEKDLDGAELFPIIGQLLEFYSQASDQ